MAGPSVMVRILGEATGLAKSFTAAGSAGATAARGMHDAFSGVLNTLNRTGVLGPFGDAMAAVDEGIGRVLEHSHEIAPAMMGIGAALAGVGIGLTALGSKDQAAHQQLRAAVEATGKSYDDYSGQVEEAIHHQERFGHTANETQDALRVLTTATNDPAKALDYLNIATNLAAARHESLTQAANDLARAYGGNAKVLKLFGIQQTEAEKKSKDYTHSIDLLGQKLGGQASAQANTFTGHLAAIKAHLEDSAAAFGTKYGPAITTAGVAMTGLGATIQIVTAGMALLRESSLVAAAATYVQVVAQGALNAVMALNPIFLVIIALAALVAAIVIAYKNVDWFRAGVDAMGRGVVAAFNTVVNAAKVVFNWIAANWPLLLGILTGPFGLAVVLVITHFNAILGFVRGIPGQIGAALASVASLMAAPFIAGYNAVVGALSGLARSIGAALGGLPGQLYNLGRSAIQGFIDGIGSLAGAVADKIKSVVTAPIDAAKSVLGIHSPSTVFAEMGRNTVLGYVQGVTAAASNVSPAVTGALAPTGTTGPGPAGPAVVIQNAVFAKEADIDLFMRRVAWTVQTGRT